MSCVRAQEFLDQNDVAVADRTDAKRDRRARDEALALARTAEHLVVAKGRSIVEIDMKHNPPDDEALAGLLLGPTGNLRAPTLRRGKTLLVGFSRAAYDKVLGD